MSNGNLCCVSDFAPRFSRERKFRRAYVRNGEQYAIYGYARVSTDGQSLVAQIGELRSAKSEKVFQEKISGARSDRKQLARLIAVLAKGDVLLVTRLDRLAGPQ